MSKRFFIFFLLSFFFVEVYSQRNEVGVFVGGSYYLGDLNPRQQFFMTKPAYGVLFRYNFNSRWAFKTGIKYGTIQAADSVSKANELRNLSFKSDILEFHNEVELNFMNYLPGNIWYAFTPYLFTGLNLVYFNPKAEYNDEWYELQPLGTEGQGTSEFSDKKKYSRVALAIPFGAGIKYNLNKSISLNFEWGMRKTFSDYLDDVSTVYPSATILSQENGSLAAALSDRSLSTEVRNNTGFQRGNSKTKDWYSFAGVILTFKIQNKQYLCPVYKQKYNHKLGRTETKGW